MHCEIIRDLLPLYMDDCCSKESRKEVAAHLESCPDCRKIYEQMRKSLAQPVELPEMKLHSISSWKASLLQAIMLFASFAILTLGVILEGNTPVGETNGLWAVALIIPATGYLLSIANWFFLRVYRSRIQFSTGSCVATLGVTLLGYGWAVLHYHGKITLAHPLCLCGILLTVVFCVLSKVLSGRYAQLLGKE